MKRHAFSLQWITAAVCVSLLASATPGRAQGIATTFEQLQLLVRSGDTVSVTDSTGREVTGRIVDLSASAITLAVSRGEHREWATGDVRQIRQRRQDSLANGAVIGLAVGAGLAGAAVAAWWERGDSAGGAEAAIAIYAGLGAGIGTGIDAMVARRQVIYQPRASAAFSVGPLVSDGRRGAAVSWRF